MNRLYRISALALAAALCLALAACGPKLPGTNSGSSSAVSTPAASGSGSVSGSASVSSGGQAYPAQLHSLIDRSVYPECSLCHSVGKLAELFGHRRTAPGSILGPDGQPVQAVFVHPALAGPGTLHCHYDRGAGGAPRSMSRTSSTPTLERGGLLRPAPSSAFRHFSACAAPRSKR